MFCRLAALGKRIFELGGDIDVETPTTDTVKEYITGETFGN